EQLSERPLEQRCIGPQTVPFSSCSAQPQPRPDPSGKPALVWLLESSLLGFEFVRVSRDGSRHGVKHQQAILDSLDFQVWQFRRANRKECSVATSQLFPEGQLANRECGGSG